MGVAAWHEYPDHVAICGWTTGIDNTVTTPKRTEVLGFFLDSPTDQDLLSNKGLALVRRSVLAPNSVGESQPGASEFTFVQALRQQVPVYHRWSVNPPVGPTIELPTVAGGIAVDARGLVHVVGSCKDQMDYPVTATGRGPQTAGSVALSDAVRSVVDLLPFGVRRTDGTGISATPWVRTSGDGGTTPTCALVSNGGTVRRMFLDYYGPPPAAGVTAELLVDRPPANALIYAGMWQIGFPNTFPDPMEPFGQGVEVWSNGSQPLGITLPSSNHSLGIPLWLTPLPGGPHQFTVQFFALMGQPLGASPCNVTSIVGSPALIVDY